MALNSQGESSNDMALDSTGLITSVAQPRSHFPEPSLTACPNKASNARVPMRSTGGI